ncbi:DUF1471 domain-containing protein [Enterobacteriaceae bacterium YMB-R22]|uniref:DUF1471 domain-containing protein n=1 Tax=Tenebrionicola larvae TaxID=2815733 RepID=UPI0020136EE3|nr:DUF1471 domain-containing protein [Tenebrionicola larvae]MBV4413588.1 DUF1471 domain-containing protein [Tenebrionicola larvae]
MAHLFALPTTFCTAELITTAARPAEEASADCVTGLNEIGIISVNAVGGNPEEMEYIVAQKADERGASWYRIIHMQENAVPDSWRVQAIIYV